MTPEQIDLVVFSIETKDGLIDYEDFLDSFVVVDIFDSSSYAADVADARSKPALEFIAQLAHQKADQKASSTSEEDDDDEIMDELLPSFSDDSEEEDHEYLAIPSDEGSDGCSRHKRNDQKSSHDSSIARGFREDLIQSQVPTIYPECKQAIQSSVLLDTDI